MAKCTHLVAILVAISQLLYGCSCVPSFEAWCSEHGRSYGSAEEYREREGVYWENAARVESLNHQFREREVTFALNQFADLSPAEFRRTVLMAPQPGPRLPPERYSTPPTTHDLPDSFDWREKGVVTPVKDQGSVGSCWAFSTVGNVEGQWAMAGNNLTSLSAEQLVDCDATFDPDNLHQDCGVFGGWPYLAYQYIEKAGGIESEANYPYCSGSGKCFPCVPPGYNKTRCGPAPSYCNKTQSCQAKMSTSKFVEGLKVKSWVAVAKDESVMQAELVSRGPLSVLINAELLQFHHFGVWDPPGCDPTSLDHAVLLVGYGVHKGLLSSKPYWLIKNSWGTKWADDGGYFMMLRGENKCGIAEQVTSAKLN